MRWRSCFALQPCKVPLLVAFLALTEVVTTTASSYTFVDKQVNISNYRMVFGAGDFPAFRKLKKAENAAMQEMCGLVNHNKVPIKLSNAPFAEPGEWPWLASIFINLAGVRPLNMDVSSCTGSIVSPWHVISASHCVQSNGSDLTMPSLMFSDTVIKVGGVCTGFNGSDAILGCRGINMTQTRKVTKILTNFNFKFTSNDVPNDDMSIYEVSEPFEFNDLVRPLCVGHLHPDKIYGVIQAGFGSDNTNHTGVLNWMPLGAVGANETMRRLSMFSAYENYPDPMIDDGGIGTCKGDSGGPTLTRSAGSPRYFLLADLTGGGVNFVKRHPKCGIEFVIGSRGPLTLMYINFICNMIGLCREPIEMEPGQLLEFLS